MNNLKQVEEDLTFPDTFPVETADLDDSFAVDMGEILVDFDSPSSQALAAFSNSNTSTTDLNAIALSALKKTKSKTKAAKKNKSPASKNQNQKNGNLKDRPKRGLSAYNFFFAAERKKLLACTPVRAIGKPLKSHGKMGFSEMAQRIAIKWKNIDPQDKLYYEGLAAKDKWRYNVEMGEWTVTKQAKRAQEAAAAADAAASKAAACAQGYDATSGDTERPSMVESSFFLPPHQDQQGVHEQQPGFLCYNPPMTPSTTVPSFDDVPLPILSTTTLDNIISMPVNQVSPASYNATGAADVATVSLTPKNTGMITMNMYNLSSSRSINDHQNNSKMLVDDPILPLDVPASLHPAQYSLGTSSLPDSFCCGTSNHNGSSSDNNNSNTVNNCEFLDRLVSNMDRDCIDLFVSMFSTNRHSAVDNNNSPPLRRPHVFPTTTTATTTRHRPSSSSFSLNQSPQ
jgi:HMG-box domain